MSAAALPQSPGGGMTKTERRNWIVALIVAFVLGFLLAW